MDYGIFRLGPTLSHKDIKNQFFGSYVTKSGVLPHRKKERPTLESY